MAPTAALRRQLFRQACRQTTQNNIPFHRPSANLSLQFPSPTQRQRPAAQKQSTRPLHTAQRPPSRLLDPPATHHHRTHTPRRSASTTTTPQPSAPRAPKPYNASAAALKSKGLDRGPASTEDTQTDFAALNVLSGAANPSTAVDVCSFDGFALDSGLIIGDGDGVVLAAGEAFVWRPWMARGGAAAAATGADGGGAARVVSGESLRGGATEGERSGGVLNAAGQFEVRPEAWGVLGVLWPKPDLLIIGTGRTIRPLAPATREYLQSLGVRIEILDTRNAASQFNMLATERGIIEVAAAMVPLGFGSK